MMKIAGSGSEFGSVSISQRHGSPDPDPYQNVMDPQHCPEKNHRKVRDWTEKFHTWHHRTPNSDPYQDVMDPQHCPEQNHRKVSDWARNFSIWHHRTCGEKRRRWPDNSQSPNKCRRCVSDPRCAASPRSGGSSPPSPGRGPAPAAQYPAQSHPPIAFLLINSAF